MRARPRSRLFRSLVATLALSLVPAAGSAAKVKAPAADKGGSAFSGFASDNGKPVNVKSDSIEVHQDEQKAIFVGHVVAVQGDSTLRAPRVTVFYDNAGSGKDAGPTGAIKRIEATGGVVVTSKDQRATGARGVFDMTTNKAVLYGNVILVQGSNVIRGKTLTVDLKTGLSRVQGGTEGRFVPDDSKAKSQ